jgi:hypothetical protein
LFRHYQKGLRLDPEHSELKKAYFGLKNLLKKTKSVSVISSYRSIWSVKKSPALVFSCKTGFCSVLTVELCFLGKTSRFV